MNQASLPPAHVLEYCRDITRRRARNFYYGLKLLPEPRRSALYAMYAWMRKADDLVDNDDLKPDEKRQQIADFRRDTEAAMRGDQPNDDPVWPAITFVTQRFALEPAHLHAMLDGQLEDVSDRSFTTFDELREYCYKVASTVGLVCIEIWGYDDPAARELAIDRGIAFQLTNILRDFREDIDNERLYLPRNEFDQHGLDVQTLKQWSKPAQCEAFVRMHIERAESFYERSTPLDRMISAECRPTLWAMTTIYRSLLDKLKADPSQLAAKKRLRLSAMQKAVIAVQAKWLGAPAKAAMT